MGEVDQPQHAVDERVAERDQRVDRPDGEPGDREAPEGVEEEVEVHECVRAQHERTAGSHGRPGRVVHVSCRRLLDLTARRRSCRLRPWTRRRPRWSPHPCRRT